MPSELESFLIRSDRQLIGLVLNSLHLSDVIRLKSASRFLATVISFYLQVRYSFHTFFEKWFLDTRGFRETLHRSGAVVSGSQALQFFDRVNYTGSDLDIFVRIGGLGILHGWLRQEGYHSFSPKDENSSNTDQYMDIRATQRKVVFSKSSHQRPLYGVFNFKTYPNFPRVDQVIQIIVVDTDPISHILFNFHSSKCHLLCSTTLAYYMVP